MEVYLPSSRREEGLSPLGRAGDANRVHTPTRSREEAFQPVASN